MRLALFALALTLLAGSLPAASSALPPPSRTAALQSLAASAMPSRLCADLKVRPVRDPEAAKTRRLGELPPGDLTLTVVNRVGDCIEPAIVRQGYGLDSRPSR